MKIYMVTLLFHVSLFFLHFFIASIKESYLPFHARAKILTREIPWEILLFLF